jgi:hypothetical protein
MLGLSDEVRADEAESRLAPYFLADGDQLSADIVEF